MKQNDPDHDPANKPANDNGSNAVTSAPSANALTALAALGAALNNVDTATVSGRSGLPMLLFKSREGSGGTYMYGQKRTVPEEGQRWAANPLTFKWGWIC